MVTEKPYVNVYFNPYLVIDDKLNMIPTDDSNWLGQHLYIPATIVKEESNYVLIKLKESGNNTFI